MCSWFEHRRQLHLREQQRAEQPFPRRGHYLCCSLKAVVLESGASARHREQEEGTSSYVARARNLERDVWHGGTSTCLVEIFAVLSLPLGTYARRRRTTTLSSLSRASGALFFLKPARSPLLTLASLYRARSARLITNGRD